MPDEPRLPEPEDYIPKLVGYAAQGIGPQLPKDGFKKHFDRNTSLVEKFSYLWDSEITHNAIVVESEHEGKDREKAAEYRQKGNDYFKKKSYLSAMEMYSQCIIHAPQERTEDEGSTSELALAYNNRSAALYYLKKYEMSLRDTDLAMMYGYPGTSSYKLYERRGKCFYAMKLKQAALEAYAKAEELLQKASLDDKAHLRITQELSRQRQITEELILDNNDAETDKMANGEHYPSSFQSSYNASSVPQLPLETNPIHPNASSSLQIQYDEDKGRHATAKENIAIGHPVIVEKPYSSVLLSAYRLDHCSACLSRVIVPIPCRQCVSVVYCGLGCEKKAWENYHKYECSYFELFDQDWVGRIGHLAHRLVVTMGMDKLLHHMNDGEKMQQGDSSINVGMSKEGVYNNDSNAIFSLLSNVKQRDEPSILQFTVFSVFLTKVLKASGFLKKQSLLSVDYDNDSTIKQLGGALLHFLQVTQCNAKGVMEMLQPTDFESLKPTCIGMGLYSTAALLNHSCYPNTELVYYGDTVVVRAIRSIFEGEEITCSYGPNFYMTSRFQRMKALASTYFFVCKCIACTDKWAMWKDVEKEYPDFSCAVCHKYCDAANIKDKTYLDCESCGHSMNINEAWGRLTVSHDEYAKAVEDVMHLRLDKALPVLSSHLALMQTYLRMPWKDMLICEVGVQNCYKMMANKKVQFAV